MLEKKLSPVKTHVPAKYHLNTKNIELASPGKRAPKAFELGKLELAPNVGGQGFPVRSVNETRQQRRYKKRAKSKESRKKEILINKNTRNTKRGLAQKKAQEIMDSYDTRAIDSDMVSQILEKGVHLEYAEWVREEIDKIEKNITFEREVVLLKLKLLGDKEGEMTEKDQKKKRSLKNKLVKLAEKETVQKGQERLSRKFLKFFISKKLSCAKQCGELRKGWKKALFGYSVTKNGEIRYSCEGRGYCRQRHVCHYCNSLVTANQARMVKESFHEFYNKYENSSVFALTLTIAHKKDYSGIFNMSEAYLIDELLRDTWAAFNRHRTHYFKEELGWLTQVRRLEETYSRTGMHPHYHIGVFSTQNLFKKYSNDEMENNLIISNMIYERWVTCYRKMLKTYHDKGLLLDYDGYVKPPEIDEDLIKGGVSVDVIDPDDAEKLADYLAKEINLSANKVGKKSYDGEKKYTWQELPLVNEKWADNAFIFHILKRHRRRTFEFGQGEFDGEKRQSFYNFLIGKDDKKEEEKTTKLDFITHTSEKEIYNKEQSGDYSKYKGQMIYTNFIQSALDIKERCENLTYIDRKMILSKHEQGDLHELAPWIFEKVEDQLLIAAERERYIKEERRQLAMSLCRRGHTESKFVKESLKDVPEWESEVCKQMYIDDAIKKGKDVHVGVGETSIGNKKYYEYARLQVDKENEVATVNRLYSRTKVEEDDSMIAITAIERQIMQQKYDS